MEQIADHLVQRMGLRKLAVVSRKHYHRRKDHYVVSHSHSHYLYYSIHVSWIKSSSKACYWQFKKPNVKGTVAVTFDDIFTIFVPYINYCFLFYSLNHVQLPSFQLVNITCTHIDCIVIVDKWISVRTKIHLSTITVHFTHTHTVLTSWILGISTCFRE